MIREGLPFVRSEERVVIRLRVEPAALAGVNSKFGQMFVANANAFAAVRQCLFRKPILSTEWVSAHIAEERGAAAKLRKAQQAAIVPRPFVLLLYRIQRAATTLPAE